MEMSSECDWKKLKWCHVTRRGKYVIFSPLCLKYNAVDGWMVVGVMSLNGEFEEVGRNERRWKKASE
jgi:hypothetical protein